jgi:hypothetical protein
LIIAHLAVQLFLGMDLRACMHFSMARRKPVGLIGAITWGQRCIVLADGRSLHAQFPFPLQFHLELNQSSTEPAMSQRVWDQVEEMFETLLFGGEKLRRSEDDNPATGIAPVCLPVRIRICHGINYRD